MDANAQNWGCGIYNDWSRRRTAKVVQILGTDWFPGKRVLDVGAGHGMNGRGFGDLGADVRFTDARQQHVDMMTQAGLSAEVMDNEKEWTVQGRFDLIIHWGLLYHLDNWKQDVRCAVERTPLLCLETIIDFGDSPSEELKIHESLSTPDQATSGIGTVMSATMFENYVTSLGCTFRRYDDADLNVEGHHVYTWGVNDGTPGQPNAQRPRRNERRFWMIQTGRA